MMERPKKVSEIRAALRRLSDEVKNPFLTGWKFLVSKVTDREGRRNRDGSLATVEFMAVTQMALMPGAEYRDYFLELSSGAKDLYWWILMEAEPGSCLVYVNRSLFMKKTKPLQPDTFRRLVSELEARGLILRVKDPISEDVFILNPQYAFRGSRITHFPKHKKYRE